MTRAPHHSIHRLLWLRAMIVAIGVTAAVALTNMPVSHADNGTLAITAQPQDTQTTVAHPTNVYATATGVPRPTVQWQSSSDGGHTYADFGGSDTMESGNQTMARLSFSADPDQDGDLLRAVFTSGTETLASRGALLHVKPNPSFPEIQKQPIDQKVGDSGSVTFEADAAGYPDPKVQWQRSNNAGSTFANINAATTAKYTFSATSADIGAEFRAVFSNEVGSVTSSVATLTGTVAIAPRITTNPVNQTEQAGATVTFTSSATGTPTPTVRWQRSRGPGRAFTDMPGEASSTLSFAARVSTFGDRFRARYTNSAGTAVTTPATLTKATRQICYYHRSVPGHHGYVHRVCVHHHGRPAELTHQN